MSTTNNSINNQIGSSANNTFLSQIRSSSGQWQQYFDQTDTHGYYSGTGNPNGVITADTGSIYSDTGAGITGLWYKTTDGVNTGWIQAAPTGPFSVSNQTFTASGTYTPTAGMVYCEVEMLGGGGGGGGNTVVPAGNFAAGTGGQAGEYAYGVFDAATIGASQAVTIGAGGTGVSGAAGNAGGTTSLGALMTATGGAGGISSAGGVTAILITTPSNTPGTGGSIRAIGANGGFSIWNFALSNYRKSGEGANSQLGAGATAVNISFGPGTNGFGYGSGGSGSLQNAGGAAQAGGNGTNGIVKITEYVIV